ncbi:MAG: YcgL domain-containing protein [Dokdonella sp.]
MQCFVYKSDRKADTYVYLRGRDDFDVLPDTLREKLGTLLFAMQFELTPERKLARGDAANVIDNLNSRGFHLQLPPPLEPALAGDQS